MAGLRLSSLTIPELFKALSKGHNCDQFYFSIKNEYDHSASIGQTAQNMGKNRYCNVWPWDWNRVVLKGAGSDYINGSHVTAPRGGQTYICTQEPLNSNYPSDTKEDFWLMVWEQNCSVIIMLNDPRENNSFTQAGLYPYYPTDTKTHQHFRGSYNPDITVTLVTKEVTAGYTTSTLLLCVEPGTPARQITHLQFSGWSDYGTPKSPAGFLAFLRKCREVYRGCGAPPVVHCSAGVGRTGTFVMADITLQMISELSTLNIDFASVLQHLRGQRMWMVQTPEQLYFCLAVIMKGVEEMNTTGFGNERITV